MVAFADGRFGWDAWRWSFRTAGRWLAGRPGRAGAALATIRARIIAEIAAFAPAEAALASIFASFTAILTLRTRRKAALIAVATGFAAAFATIFAVRPRTDATRGALATRALGAGAWARFAA